jgi:hypothetical protein
MRSRMILRALLICAAMSLWRLPALAEGITALAPGELLRGRFVQERILQGFAAPLKSEGSFVLAPGQGLIWRAEKPFALITLMTDKGLAQRSDGATTLDLPASRAPFLAGLYAMLSGALAGNWHVLERDFAIDKSQTDGTWSLRLTPRNSSPGAAMPITQINITGVEFVEHVEIVKQGGDRDVLTFLDQTRTNTPMRADEIGLLKAIGQP